MLQNTTGNLVGWTLAAAAVCADVAVASEWKFVNFSGDTVIYIDASSIRDENILNGNIKSAWFRFDHTRDQAISHRETLYLYHFRCDERKLAVSQSVKYDANGRVVERPFTAPNPNFQSVIPDSVAAAMFAAACNGLYFSVNRS